MREREKVVYKFLRNTLMLGLVVGVPILNYKSSGRVITALAGGEVDCSWGEAANKEYPYDVIAVPGAGVNIDEYGNVELNEYQEERLDAAALLYIQGYAPHIILLDGGVAQLNNTGISYLQGRVKEMSSGKMELPDDSVFMDKVSINTATNVRELEVFMDENDLEKAILPTHKNHYQRVGVLACNYGINAKTVAVESFIPETRDPSVKPLRGLYVGTKEGLEIFSLMWDPGGLFTISAKSAYNSLVGR